MIVLASASVRRRVLLDDAGIAHRVLAMHVDETPPSGTSPEDAATEIAARKAHRAAGQVEEGLVLGADTLVALGSRILGKPQSVSEAREMLTLLSGREHVVVTGLCLVDAARGCDVRRAVTTLVRFRRIEAAEMEEYLASEEPMDKAGAYGIQGRGGAFVEEIRGPFDNVVGLPVGDVREMIEEMS